ncbi:YocH [Bacillus methanolicus PB1]|uniref:YocH n=1 Tax=Bacillus methanolicus PB1 TaxID=997296 RepID=I3DV67_BACMT|nr:LysM peptidoglycan-binding and 3D domain-containing protein [Bacillus methanolicus]EIJ78138.1 YocH [Bacillus methanolicus PB1]
MKKHLYSMLAAATISGIIGANAQAEEIVVKKGDTLWEISQKYDVTVEDLKKWNGLSSDVIYPNDKLEVLPEKHYIVKCGDTLWNIAKTNGVTVQDLKTWNNLNSDLIKPGLNLVIYPTADGTNTGTPSSSARSVKASSAQNKQTAVKSAVKPQPVQNKQTTAKTAVKTATSKAPVANVAKELTVTATAYTASCAGCSGVTSTGIDLKANPNAKVISVDPSVIPLGSKVYVEGYGYATAADTGGAIKGNVIDVFIPSKEKAVQWGRKQVKVTILK